MSSAAVLIPVKAFSDAKLRLAAALSADERRMLAKTMAEGVVQAAGSLPVAIVCDDAEVASWARSLELLVIDAPGRGLNRAVEVGVEHLARSAFARVIVAHADLPMATDLTWVARFAGVTLVPDRHDDGTNVACVPARSGFRFAYGAGSFHRHLAETRRLGLALRIARRPDLAWDVDSPDDLLYATR